MSTQRELLAAAKTLGIAGLNTNSRVGEIRKAINAKLGNPDLGDDDQNDEQTDQYAELVTKHGEEAVATASGPVVAKPNNIPNLSPTGIWEGRRARIRRTRTGHNDMGGAIFNWNGYPTIVPLNEVVDVAWPIFGIIQGCTGMNMKITQKEDPEDRARVQNIKKVTYYDKYPYQYMGVTPGTEDLPESPWEYTLDMYVDEFKGFTVRMWRQLCILWEIDDEQAGIKPGLGPEKEAESRCNAIHYALNLPQAADLETRKMVRNEKRVDIGMAAKAA